MCVCMYVDRPMSVCVAFILCMFMILAGLMGGYVLLSPDDRYVCMYVCIWSKECMFHVRIDWRLVCMCVCMWIEL